MSYIVQTLKLFFVVSRHLPHLTSRKQYGVVAQYCNFATTKKLTYLFDLGPVEQVCESSSGTRGFT